LGPTRHKRWVAGSALHDVWRTPAAKTLGADLERFPAELVDPFE
jgi:hypothetical protein